MVIDGDYVYMWGEGGDIGLFIILVPKVFKESFLIRWGLLMNFDWLVYSVDCLNISTTNCNLQKG